MGRSIPCGSGALSGLVGGSHASAAIPDRDIPGTGTIPGGDGIASDVIPSRDADPVVLAGIVGRGVAGRGRQGTSFRVGRMGVGIVVGVLLVLSLRWRLPSDSLGSRRNRIALR